jgi:hypothetical protein
MDATPSMDLSTCCFCRADCDQLPIIRVKHVEIRRTISLVVPAAERELLLSNDGSITPNRL